MLRVYNERTVVCMYVGTVLYHTNVRVPEKVVLRLHILYDHGREEEGVWRVRKKGAKLSPGIERRKPGMGRRVVVVVLRCDGGAVRTNNQCGRQQ